MKIHDSLARRRPAALAAGLVFFSALVPASPALGQSDPGVRGGAIAAGQPLSGLTAQELAYFNDGLARFLEVDGVPNGLGPRFNSNQCAGCHSYPAIGGSSPVTNPLAAVAVLGGGRNAMPWFETTNGPIREARFQKTATGATDGGVHDLFVITGRSDAAGCNIAQPTWGAAGNPVTGQGGNPNVIFRIPTPTFGTGLIESIDDSTIIANMSLNTVQKLLFGISGHTNNSGNDGTITRFGWKAQNKSLLVFSGEAYNVEMGVTNQLFMQERDTTAGCRFNKTPEDAGSFQPAGGTYPAVLSDVEAFSNFMRMLAPPAPAAATASTTRGRALFDQVGCSLCHTATMTTGAAETGTSGASAALSNQAVNLYSDLLVHNMGTGLADGVSQGSAGPDEFRTAPLWGLGQRVYFLHDGRTNDVQTAVTEHAGVGSEANVSVLQYDLLPASSKQDLLNFLRSL